MENNALDKHLLKWYNVKSSETNDNPIRNAIVGEYTENNMEKI